MEDLDDLSFDLGGGIQNDAPSSPPRASAALPMVVSKLPTVDGLVKPKAIGDLLPFLREHWYTLGTGDGHESYHLRKGEIKKNVHWGQLKLLITEIQFLTLYWNPKDIPNPTVIYVGAAPGHHIIILLDLFRNINFILYDPRGFDVRLRDHPRVTIKKEFFTDAHAEYYRNKIDAEEKNPYFFICDIRSSNYVKTGDDTDDEEEEEKEVMVEVAGEKKNVKIMVGKEANELNEKIAWDNMQMQAGWVKKIRPVKAHLKMRLPYVLDITIKEGEMRNYLGGVVYRQPWCGSASSETRLVPGNEYIDAEWNIRSYESACFYHNHTIRENYLFLNPLTGGKERVASELGLDNDYDSVATANILKEYLEKFSVNPDRESSLSSLVKSLFLYIIDAIASPKGKKRDLVTERQNLRAGNAQRGR
jgi:hypothetical protein